VGGGGDLGADGYSDLVVGAPFADDGGVDGGTVFVYRLPVGSGVVIGSGCGGAATVPSLTLTAPVLGAVATIVVTNASTGAPGSLVASLGTPVPSPLGGGCVAYVDLMTITELTPFTTDAAGTWALTLSIPLNPTLPGIEVVIQAAVFQSGAPLGFDVTNAVGAQIGY
jgi:hypothetical protein